MELFPSFESYMVTPEQVKQKTAQQAMIDALRNVAAPQATTTPAQQQAGQVVNANAPSGSFGSGMRSGLGLGLGDKLGSLNLGTALQYGTTPGSQQTAMLAAQNAGF